MQAANQDILFAQLFGNDNLAMLFGVPVQYTQEMLAKSMLSRMHQNIYQHLINCYMQKTAAAFLEESKYFPHFKGTLENIPNDMLIRLWSLMTFSNPNVFKEPEVALPPPASPLPLEVKIEPTPIPHVLAPPQSENLIIEDKKEQQQRSIFQCRHSGCTSSFSTMANMKRHEKLHTGEKPFICPAESCGKKFARKYDMKIHMRIHTKEKPYVCNICDKRFSRISSLREHERNLHQVDNSTKRRRFDSEDYPEEELSPMETPLHEEAPLSFPPITMSPIPLNRSVDSLDIPSSLVPLPNLDEILYGLPTSPILEQK